MRYIYIYIYTETPEAFDRHNKKCPRIAVDCGVVKACLAGQRLFDAEAAASSRDAPRITVRWTRAMAALAGKAYVCGWLYHSQIRSRKTCL